MRLGQTVPLLRIALLIGMASTGRANTVVFATGPRTLGGYAENASATFDISGNTITVHLLNLQADPTDVNQAISSLRFTINGVGAPTPNSTLTGISDTVLAIDSSGRPTSVAPESTTAWTVGGSPVAGGQQMWMCAGECKGGTAGLIIGGPDALFKGEYSLADSTLRTGSAQWIIASGLTYTKNGSKNELSGMDTRPDFTITFPNTNLSPVVISNVTFGFGYDGLGGSLTVPQETPEPDSVILFGTGLVLVALAAGVRYCRRH